MAAVAVHATPSPCWEKEVLPVAAVAVALACRLKLSRIRYHRAAMTSLDNGSTSTLHLIGHDWERSP